MLPTTALLTLLPFLASASPFYTRDLNTSSDSSPVYLTAIASRTEINGKLITASGNNFYIDIENDGPKTKPTQAEECPPDFSKGCYSGNNITAIIIDPANGTAKMILDTPPLMIQNIYAGSDYKLHFDVAHASHDSSNNQPGSIYTGFGQTSTDFTFSANGQQGFYACPGDGGAWQVFTSEGAQCIFFQAQTTEFKVGANQYAAYYYY